MIVSKQSHPNVFAAFVELDAQRGRTPAASYDVPPRGEPQLPIAERVLAFLGGTGTPAAIEFTRGALADDRRKQRRADIVADVTQRHARGIYANGFRSNADFDRAVDLFELFARDWR